MKPSERLIEAVQILRFTEEVAIILDHELRHPDRYPDRHPNQQENRLRVLQAIAENNSYMDKAQQFLNGCTIPVGA